ncbi:MAG TPA: M24 family metallopeptidase, partial [Thermoplasmatales archaeon]|nr:M24 family metallopeptidase [Thermoplasmatales archaeon]
MTVEVDGNHYSEMIQAADDALERAIEEMKPGISLSEIGRVVEETVTSYGYKPIDNLTGHSIKRYILHSGLSIPNVSSMRVIGKPKKGDVVAIEPFVTNGRGHVVSGEGSNIYIVKPSLRMIRERQARLFLQQLKNNFKTLPFAHRWCTKLSGYSESI